MTAESALLCVVCVLLMPCALGGLALLNAGLGRARNVVHSLLSALCVTAVAVLAWFAVGAAFEGNAGGHDAALWIGGKPWGLIGAGRFLLRDADFSTAASLPVLFGMLGVALAALIPLGAAAERWRLSASCLSTLILAGLLYPLFVHWAWGGGWLAQLGANYHLGRGFVDAGGAGVIQAVGGMTALAIASILGPRRGKFAPQGPPMALPAHNAAFVLFGCFLCWIGFIAVDCAGSLLFSGVTAAGIPLIPVNATLAASAALLTGVGITRARFGKADASLSANAWVAGLVASAAGCAAMRPAGAVVTGAVAGALAVLSVEWLELYCRVDDPGGAISVHALGGVWGLLAVPLFSPAAGGPDQWLAQLAGIATLIGFVLPAAWATNWLLDRFIGQRIPPQGERLGLDVYELGAGGYPDFMTHTDEY